MVRLLSPSTPESWRPARPWCWSSITRAHVEAALAEFRRRGGAKACCKLYGYRLGSFEVLDPRTSSWVPGTKCLMGLAFGVAFDCDPLTSGEHSGGNHHACQRLRSLGFEVRERSVVVRAVARVARKVRQCISKTVGILACTLDKHEGVMPARELYAKSYLFRAGLEWLERQCHEVLILSAEYEVVELDTVVASYDKTVKDQPRAERERWAARVRDDLRARFAGQQVTVISLAGRDYASAVQPLASDAVSIEEPCAGLMVGERKRWFKQQREVAALVSAGKSSSWIAKAVGLCASTIEVYRRRVAELGGAA